MLKKQNIAQKKQKKAENPLKKAERKAEKGLRSQIIVFSLSNARKQYFIQTCDRVSQFKQ